MPTYDYVCDECGHEFEAYESITAAPQVDCPKCAQPKLRRKIGPGAAILFKGSGFYQTDYRSESYKKAAQAEKPAAKSSEGAASSSPTPTATTSPTSSSSKPAASVPKSAP